MKFYGKTVIGMLGLILNLSQNINNRKRNLNIKNQKNINYEKKYFTSKL
jgi:hypothetical protein